MARMKNSICLTGLAAAFALTANFGLADVARPPRIVAFGDSITEGVIGIRPEENWLRLL